MDIQAYIHELTSTMAKILVFPLQEVFVWMFWFDDFEARSQNLADL